MKKKFFLLIIFLFVMVGVVGANFVIAGECGDGEVCLDNPLPVDSPQKLIGQIIKGVLGLVGSLALAMFVYGGFTWMLAAGNSRQQYA